MTTFVTYRNHILNLDEIASVFVGVDSDDDQKEIWGLFITFIHNEEISPTIVCDSKEEAIKIYERFLDVLQRNHSLIDLNDQ